MYIHNTIDKQNHREKLKKKKKKGKEAHIYEIYGCINY
jgi:hypothetical protein